MLNLDLYIHGSGYIAPPLQMVQDPLLKLLCSEPDYSSHIPPMLLRRMSKIVRMGIGAAKICLDKAGLAAPEAISIGTAFGCLQDTEVFLSKMVLQEEKMLTPTAFIQSTHNTVAGQIALLLGCRGHNMTYAHRGHSLEHALIDAQLYLHDHPDATVLAGGIDELTDTSFTLLQRAGIYRAEPVSPDHLFLENDLGSIGGEGAGFLALSSQHANAIAHIKCLHLFKTEVLQEALDQVRELMRHAAMTADDIDLIVLGMNGDLRTQLFYDALRLDIFHENQFAAFKHLCGEYPTAGAFALALVAEGFSENNLPESFFLNGRPARMKRVLILNNYLDQFSFYVVERG